MNDTSDQPAKIWLVEDNEMFATGVQRTIKGIEGLSCSGNFKSVEQAFAALDKCKAPDVILLDVQLPGMDGITALSKLKELAPTARVVILTVFDETDKIFRAVCAGASGYMLKSSSGEQIAAAIHQVLAGGVPMTPEVARKVLEVFEKSGAGKKEPDDYNLTPRECDILRLMAEGMVKKEIGESLGISVNTVSTHLQRVYDKLHVKTNTGAVAKALRERLI